MRRMSSRWICLIAASVVLVACASGPTGSASRPKAAIAAFVRVDQVGYAADAGKRAYLMTREPAPATTFEVVSDGGGVVASGDVGADLGDWGKRFPHVYAVDFDAVTAPGSYVIRVTGDVTATSPGFLVGDPAELFSPLLANSLLFYQAQRDGPNVVGDVFDRQPSHLHDRRAQVYYARPLQPRLHDQGSGPGSERSTGRRLGRLVRRGRLHQGRPDRELRRRDVARRQTRSPAVPGTRRRTPTSPRSSGSSSGGC